MSTPRELEPTVYVASGMSPAVYDTTAALEVTAMQYVAIDEWDGVLVLVNTGTASDSDVTATLTLAHSTAIDTDLELSGALASDVFEMNISVASSDYSTTEGRIFVGDVKFEAVGWAGGYIQPVFRTGITTTKTLGLTVTLVLYGPNGNSDTRPLNAQQQTIVTAY